MWTSTAEPCAAGVSDAGHYLSRRKEGLDAGMLPLTQASDVSQQRTAEPLPAPTPRRCAAAPDSVAPSTRRFNEIYGSADPWSAECFRQRPAALADHGSALPRFLLAWRGARGLSGPGGGVGGGVERQGWRETRPAGAASVVPHQPLPPGPNHRTRTWRPTTRRSAVHPQARASDRPLQDQTLKRKCSTSPSCTRYSLPSRRRRPASLAPASPLNLMKSS